MDLVSQSSHGIARNGLAPSAEVKDTSHSAQRHEGKGGKCLPDLGQTGREIQGRGIMSMRRGGQHRPLIHLF